MNNSGKYILLVLAIVYFLSPIDLMSGIVIDDIAVLAAALTPFFRGPGPDVKAIDDGDD